MGWITSKSRPEDAASPTPGTVHLVDLEGTLNAKHAKGSRNQDVVLVPAPSADPEDPLNWSPRRKTLSTVCMCVYTLMVGVSSAAIYSLLTPISEATSLTLDDLNAGTGYMFLAFGWGCLFWQPLALQYGKRPVYLFSILATMGIQIWAPYTKSNGQWIANKLLQGFVGAPIESLCEISVTDMYGFCSKCRSVSADDEASYFQHERGAYIGLYALLLAGSNFFAPIIAGFIADGQGWQWVLYWCAIFCGIGFVFLFFFMEETNYSRSIIAGHEVKEAPRQGSGQSTPQAFDEKRAPADADIEPASPSDLPTSSSYSKKSYTDKIKLFRAADLKKPNRLAGMTLRPLIFLTFPVIFYAGFCYGSNLIWFNVLNGTASLILGGEPYGFSASMVGLSYLSPLIGVVAGSFYTGPIGDRIVLWMARRNGGILEAEHRLWLFAPSLLFIPFGLILWGVGAANSIHWFGCVFAMGVIAFTNTVGLQLSISYALDSYKDLGGEAIVTVILIRNTMSFAIGYGITPWVTNMGLQNAFIVAAFAGMAQVATFFLFLRWGKGLRRDSGQKYAKYVEKMASDGMVH